MRKPMILIILSPPRHGSDAIGAQPCAVASPRLSGSRNLLIRQEFRPFARVDAFEFGLCERLNRVCRRDAVRNAFRLVSRLGDGVFWYLLMLLIPVCVGAAG